MVTDSKLVNLCLPPKQKNEMACADISTKATPFLGVYFSLNGWVTVLPIFNQLPYRYRSKVRKLLLLLLYLPVKWLSMLVAWNITISNPSY